MQETIRVQGIRHHRREQIRSLRERLRDPCLTALLLMLFCALFLAAPFAALGSPVARIGGEALVLLFVLIVVMLSHSRAAIAAILVGLSCTVANLLAPPDWHPPTVTVLGRFGTIVTFLALSWVVARAVYAPGPITSHRVKGAMVLYLNIAVIFASAYRLVWEMRPSAFANLPAPTGSAGEISTMLYFSFTTLTTTGYGDVVPLDPFVRSLATLEAVIGQLYLVTTLARLVTLELEHRRR